MVQRRRVPICARQRQFWFLCKQFKRANDEGVKVWRFDRDDRDMRGDSYWPKDFKR